MAFTVEDGSIVTGANSYLSIADADMYHSDRGNAAWTGTDDVKQAALIKATDYIFQKYTGRFKGYRVSTDQPLDWPRSDIDGIATNEIPQELKDSVAILALESLSSDLNPNLERGGRVKREKVDVIEIEYMDGASSGTTRPAVDGMLRRYLTGSTLNRKVIRV